MMRIVRKRLVLVLTLLLLALVYSYVMKIYSYRGHTLGFDFLPFSASEDLPVVYTSQKKDMEYLRRHAKGGGKLPDDSNIDTIPAWEVHLTFHSYLDNLGTLCGRRIRLGTIFNGGYRVCDDDLYRPRVPCVVYSFGFGCDMSFEEDVARLYGCDVHYFDPTLGAKGMHNSGQVRMYWYGLPGKQEDLGPADQTGPTGQYPTATLSNLRTKLGHSDVPLDLLKLDIGGSEWTALADMVRRGELTGVRQLVVELHHHGGWDSDVTRRRLHVLVELERAGFRVFSTTMDESLQAVKETLNNVYPVIRTSIYEMSFLNTRFHTPHARFQFRKPQRQAKSQRNVLEGQLDMDYFRQHSKAGGGLPDDRQLKALSPKDVYIAYHSYLDNLQVLCGLTIKLGQLTDGGYKVCDDRSYRPRNPCLVYSFGISNDFSFDDDAERIYGCDVFSFDPSMAVPSHKRSNRSTFLRRGLGGKGGQLEEQGERMKAAHGWQVDSLTDIKVSLGHTGRVLDLLKIDIEASEWISLGDMAASGELSKVRQLIVEFHLFSWKDAELVRRRLTVLRLLEKAGFRIFFTRQNAGWPGIPRMMTVYPVVRTICYETSFVNTKLNVTG